MNTTSRFYDSFSFIYPIVDYFLNKQKKSFFKEINQLKQGRLLDIGIGHGLYLNEYKNHEVIGIDISAKMIEKARKNTGDSIVLWNMNAENLKFEMHSFNYIVLAHVVTTFPNTQKVFKEISRVLKPGGKLIILNHFTPSNFLFLFDYIFQPFSSLFQFKSLYFPKDIKGLQDFKLEKSKAIGRFSYYKILMFTKK